jgi:hypothetical protein
LFYFSCICVLWTAKSVQKMPTIQVNYFDCMFSRFNVFHLHFPSWSCFSLLYSYGRIARNRQKWLVVTKHIWSLMKFVKWLKMRVPCELWYQLSFWSSIFYFKKTLHREKKIGPYFCWFQLCINNLTCGKKKDKFWGIYNNKNKKTIFLMNSLHCRLQGLLFSSILWWIAQRGVLFPSHYS